MNFKVFILAAAVAGFSLIFVFNSQPKDSELIVEETSLEAAKRISRSAAEDFSRDMVLDINWYIDFQQDLLKHPRKNQDGRVLLSFTEMAVEHSLKNYSDSPEAVSRLPIALKRYRDDQRKSIRKEIALMELRRAVAQDVNLRRARFEIEIGRLYYPENRKAKSYLEAEFQITNGTGIAVGAVRYSYQLVIPDRAIALATGSSVIEFDAGIEPNEIIQKTKLVPLWGEVKVSEEMLQRAVLKIGEFRLYGGVSAGDFDSVSDDRDEILSKREISKADISRLSLLNNRLKKIEAHPRYAIR